MSRKVSLGLLGLSLCALLARRAQAEESEASGHAALSLTPPPVLRGFQRLDRPTGMAEAGFGWLTLPTAKVCVERSAAGCKAGDTSFALEGWQLYRANLRWALGAGLLLGLIPTTDAPRRDPEGIERDHARRYLTVEAMVRFYPYVGEGFEFWIGATGGLVVVSDRFAIVDKHDQALVGPSGVTIRTEGGTVGGALGGSLWLSQNWSIGSALRYGNWFLPDTPARDPLADEASLTGRNSAFSLGLNVSYRILL